MIKNFDRFFMYDYIEVTKQVNLGRTLLIPGTGNSQYIIAKALALELKTYSYCVYQKKNGELIHYGYAIPT